MIGFHFVGPNAGEITQGFGLAVRLGAKKSDFDKLVSAFSAPLSSCLSVHVCRPLNRPHVPVDTHSYL